MKRYFNDVFKGTKAGGVVSIRQKTGPLPYAGFNQLPAEMVNMIMKAVPIDLDGITRQVCKRWKGNIEKRWAGGHSRDPMIWAIKNHATVLVKWMVGSLTMSEHDVLFLSDLCLEHANLDILKWLSKMAAELGCDFLTMCSVVEASAHGDLAFLKGVLELCNGDGYGSDYELDEFCMQASCASGDVEKCKWWVYKELYGSRATITVWPMIVRCLRKAIKFGHLNIVKWLFSLIPLEWQHRSAVHVVMVLPILCSDKAFDALITQWIFNRELTKLLPNDTI